MSPPTSSRMIWSFLIVTAASTIAYYELLGRPYARSLSYGLNPPDWIEGKINQRKIRPKEVTVFIPRDKRSWLVAETVDYARGPLPYTLPYWQRISVALEGKHRLIGAYATNRVQVKGFEDRGEGERRLRPKSGLSPAPYPQFAFTILYLARIGSYRLSGKNPFTGVVRNSGPQLHRALNQKPNRLPHFFSDDSGDIC